MRVKLLKDRSVPVPPSNALAPKVYRRRGAGYQTTAKKGAVLSVSDATGKKWVDAGLAEATTEEPTREPLK